MMLYVFGIKTIYSYIIKTIYFYVKRTHVSKLYPLSNVRKVMVGRSVNAR